MFRRLGIFGLVLGSLGLALPAAAGTLSPRLALFAAAWRQAPQGTLSRALGLNATDSRSLAPRVRADGTVQVYLHYRSVPPGGEALAALGARDMVVSPALGVVQAWVPIAKLDRAAALGGITRVDLPVYAWVKGQPFAHPATDTCSPVQSGLHIDQQGIAAENVGPVHTQGVTGAGVKVGIMSNGADCASSSQAAGYLPSTIYIPSGLAGSGDEGTAMMEEVHAMAPAAALGFCGPATTVDFVTCLGDFASWGATVISDDLGFFPVGYNFDLFQAPDGGDAITEFAEANPDITLTTAAGNDQEDYFESDYVGNTNPTSPSGVPITLSPTYTPDPNGGVGGRSYQAAMDFGASLGESTDSAMQVVIAPGINLFADLTWDDPLNGPYDDLDLFLINQSGQVACSPNQNQWCNSTLDQIDNPTPSNPNWIPPLEVIDYTNNTSSNQTLYLVALCYNCGAHGTQPLHVKLYGFMDGGGTFNYVTNGGISGHVALGAEFTTAAAQYNGAAGGSTLDYYSDTGPFAYGDWLNGTHSRAKPDITGTDGVTVSGAGGFGSPFYGTSAASPNVGSVVALLRSFAPNGATSAAGWKALVMSAANPGALTNYTLDAGGAGLTDAAAALASLDSPITAEITAPTGSPAKVEPATNVQFEAECDYGGTQPLSYKWTFGGNSGIPDSTKLTPDPVQYANGGIYTVSFICSDPVQSKTAQLTVAVQAAATANDLSLSTTKNQPLTGQLGGTGIGGEQVTYQVVANPQHGSLTLNATSGSFTYTPDAGYSGKDSFTFDIDNGVMTSNVATVSITVEAPPPSGGGGGGGAFGGLGLVLLAGVFALSRRHH